jgi:MFS superfamily sulfate permease-like transporter
MLFLAPLIALMPQATLAAIVVVYSIGLIKPAEFRAVLKVRRMEFVWAVAALIGVALLGTLRGILAAIIISLAALAHQVADPPVYALGRKRGTNFFRPLSKDHPDDETFPGLLMMRLEGRIFFANADRIGQKMRLLIQQHKPKIVAVHFRSVIDLEYTALKTLIEAESKLREQGILLWLVGLNPKVLDMVMRSQLGEILGRERMFFNLEMAVAKHQSLPQTERQP